MKMENLLDWLDSLALADHVYANRLENKKEKSIGLYDRTQSFGRPVMALGGAENSSYDVWAMSILIHWTRGYRESETAAQAVWDALNGAKHIDIPGGQHIQFIQMNVPRPVYVSTDANGIHEYVINFNLYYRR